MYWCASYARLRKEACFPLQAPRHDVTHEDGCADVQELEGTWKVFFKQSTILSLAEGSSR